MDTNVFTPMDVFHLPRYFTVPLFQRPYVWTEDDQWLPLWQDVMRMADLRLTDPSSRARHFLGAIVLQAEDVSVSHLSTRNVIDGQQRLTTLQLLMDAVAAVLEETGLDMLAGRLDAFTHNPENFVTAGHSRLKLRHNNRDQAAFDEVMDAEPPVDHASLTHAGSLVANAHRFFVSSAAGWLGRSTEESFRFRAEALTDVLSNGLQIVVIDLQANENSQEIFETLNARGTPLTAADLIKNYVFQRLAAEGADTTRAYVEQWPFETAFWEAEVSVGRYLMTRSSLFLNQWLGSRIGEELSPRTTFARFKAFVEIDSGQKMTDLLPTIKSQAQQYEAWTRAANDHDRSLNAVEMAVYRMQASGIELLKPVLIWLHEPGLDIPEGVREQIVRDLESWVVRRQLLRLPTSDQGRVIADIVRLGRRTASTDLASRVQEHLAGLNVISTYWPGDDELRRTLATEAFYRRYSRGRLRVFLEAIENRLRAKTNQPQVPRRGYPIEHILPQKWESAWPVDGLEAQQARASHVHRLGNLTLLTTSLNSSVSNGPWAGPKGKLAKLRGNDTFLLNRIFLDLDVPGWDEVQIDARTSEMLESLLAVWPVPAGHKGDVVDPRIEGQPWIDFKDIVAAGLISPGSELFPREGKWAQSRAIVRTDGRLELDGKEFDTPSGAATYLKSSPSNGWYFWRLADGTRLADVRSQYRAKSPRRDHDAAFDWTILHAILERLPVGRWTSYGELADAVGTSAQAVGVHVAACAQCVNLHRVLTWDGSPIAHGVGDSQGSTRIDLLSGEGVAFVDGKADRERALVSDALVELTV